MLTPEGLKEQAELLKLPLNKQRAIVREYAQTIILRATYQTDFAQKIFFMGGTALRFAYGLKRFSEDLDFNAEKLSPADFKEILASCSKALEKEGFTCEISQKERTSLLIGQLKLTNILQNYKITPLKSEKLMVKVEIDRPVWHMETESAVVDRFGYLFSILLMSKGALLSGKVDALINRCRGRDIYDVIFMLQRKFPLKVELKQVILERIENIKPAELMRLSEQVEPFLVDEEEKDFVVNAKTYIGKLLT
jgi:predicted nucleotidyltransferase component of viral defense system